MGDVSNHHNDQVRWKLYLCIWNIPIETSVVVQSSGEASLLIFGSVVVNFFLRQPRGQDDWSGRVISEGVSFR